MKLLTDLADRAWLPDAVIRAGIGRLNRLRLSQESKRHGDDPGRMIAVFVEAMQQSPIALATDKANDQHYRRTADAWLANMDARRKGILPVIEYDILSSEPKLPAITGP